MKRKLLCAVLCAALLCAACSAEKTKTRYSYSFFGTFDTFVVLAAYTHSKDDFDRAAALCESEFRRYHELFDPYNHSDEVNNVYNLNAGAWKQPMPVEKELMELLVRCKQLQGQIPGTVNIAMGKMLRLWHEARSDAEYDPFNAYVPDMKKLQQAAQHCSMDDLVLDEKNMTVFYRDEGLRLELGAVAKGFAAEKVAGKMAEILPSFSLNAGGNIVVGQAPGGKTGHWKAGIQNPDKPIFSDEETQLCTIWLENQALVTSGDYQRYYVVGEEKYHHIIDEKTCMPAGYVRAVSVLAPSSFMADYLSTATFLMPYEEARAMIDALEGVEALWVMPDGQVQMTEGFQGRLIATEL